MSPESSDTPFKKKAFVLHYYFSHSSKDGEETTAVEQNAQSIRRKQPSTLYFTQKDWKKPKCTQRGSQFSG